MNIEPVVLQRVRYVERAQLKTADLAAEQSSRLSGRWLHQIAEHEWGIVVGLAVDVDNWGFTIQSGVAVDGFGRELVLSSSLSLPWIGWSEDGQPGQGTKTLFDLVNEPSDTSFADLWLMWDRRLDSSPNPHARWLETPRLRILPSSSDLDPRSSPVGETDPVTIVQSGLADDPAREWPVFLGRVKQTSIASSIPYTVEHSPARPYARLRGETVTAASRLAQMQLSGGPGPSRFAVALPNKNGTAGNFDTEPLAIQEPGDLVTHGESHMFGFESIFGRRQGDLVIENRPEVAPEDLRSLPYLVEKLANPADPLAKEIYNKLSSESKNYLSTLNQGEAPDFKEIRKHLANDFSRILNTGLPAVILRDLPVNRIPWLPGSGKLPFFPRKQMFPREIPIASRRMRMFSRRPLNFGEETEPDENDTLSQEETRALLDSFFPGLFNDSADALGKNWGMEFQQLPKPPAAAAPWQIYHTIVKQEDGQQIHQLRVEIENPGDKGDPRLFRFVIGTRPTPDTFEECLIVQADGTVAMLGKKIRVIGRVMEGPVQADPQDPRLAAALMEAAARGVPSSTKLTAKIELDDHKLKGYSITNHTGSLFTCSPLYENIRKAGSRTPIREGPVGNLITVPANSSVRLDADLNGLTGKLVVAIRVIGVDQNGYYAMSDDQATVTM
jgi:hypothetical protein